MIKTTLERPSSQEDPVIKSRPLPRGRQTCLLNFENKLTLNYHNFCDFYLFEIKNPSKGIN